MGKSSSGRHRTGSEVSSRSERRRDDEQDPSRRRSGADSMTTSSRRKSSRRGEYDDDAAAFAPTITAEPSEIPDGRRDTSRKENDYDDTRRRSSKSHRSSKDERSRGESDGMSRDDGWRDSRRSNRSGGGGQETARAFSDRDAALPQNQFPGEMPATYTKPYRPPGLASEYYNDQGESVQSQPGVRPNQPSIVTSAEQAHLMEPTLEAKPPPEPSSLGQLGAASGYFGNLNYDSDSGQQTTPSKPQQSLGMNRPSKHSIYGVSPRSSPGPQSSMPSASQMPGAMGFAAPALGAAAAYYASGSGGGGLPGAYQTPNRPPPGPQSGPTPYSAPPGLGGSQQSSNAALYGGAAAVAGAAAGAYLSQSHEHRSHSQHQTTTQTSAYAGGSPPAQGKHMHHIHRHEHTGLFGRFVDWWRDPDAIAQYEQYTEAIGVCKYCFDPMSTPADAPRRHGVARRRPSSGSRHGSTTRVDKTYRYSSDEERRKRSSVTKKVVLGGLAGYGASKVGEAVYKQQHDFDDTYSVKSGRPANQSRVSFQDEPQHERYGDVRLQRRDSDRRLRKSERSSNKEKRRQRRSSSSSSNSSGRGLSRGAAMSTGAAAAGLALGAAALDRKSRHRSKSRSRSPTSRRKYYSKRVSPMHSYVDLSTTNDGPSGFMGFFTSPSANAKKGKKPKGLFNFTNNSSSSSDADLRFGEGTVRRKASAKRLRPSNGKRDGDHSTAAMMGLVAAGTALAAEADRRHEKGKHRHDADEYAARPSRNSNGQRIHMENDEAGDEWYDIDGDAESDTALAYGGGISAAQSQESLTQPRKSRPSDNFGDKTQRRYHDSMEPAVYAPASSYPVSAVQAAVVAGAAGAIGGWAASNATAYDAKSPLGSLPPMRDVEPRPISNPPSSAVSPYYTRVSSTNVPLQQPQPMVPVASFIDGIGAQPLEAERQSRREGTQGEKRRPRRDSSPAKLPTQDPRGSVNFSLTDEQLENEKQSKARRSRRRDSATDKNKRQSADATVLINSTSNQDSVSRQEPSTRPRRSSEASQKLPDADDRVAEIEQELEKLYREHRQAEERKRNRDSGLKKVAETAAIGAATAVAATALAGRDSKTGSGEETTFKRKSSLKKSRERDSSPQSETQQQRIARMAAQRVKSTPSPVQHDDYGSFFVPAELREHLKEHNDNSEHRDDIGATVVEVVPGAPKPRQAHSFDPYLYRRFGLELEDDPSLYPWPVPMLGLVEPTPPGSHAPSIRGDETPVIEPKVEEPLEEIGEPLERRGSKVTWGDYDTYVFEVQTPEYERSDYVRDAEVRETAPTNSPSPEIISHEPGEEPQHRPSVGRTWTLAEAEAEKLEKEVPIVDDRPRVSHAWTVDEKEASQIEHDQNAKIESVPRITKTEPASRETSIPSTMAGLEKMPQAPSPPGQGEDGHTQAFYQSPFAETVSDLGVMGGNYTLARSENPIAEEGRHATHEPDQSRDEAEPQVLETSPGPRLSKSERRRRERAFADEDRSVAEQHEPEPDSDPVTPLPMPDTDSVFDYMVDHKGVFPIPSASVLGIGASAILVADQLTKSSDQHDVDGPRQLVDEPDEPFKPKRSGTFDDSTPTQARSGSKTGYRSDPEDWERSTDKKTRKSKSSSKSDVGGKTSSRSKDRRQVDEAASVPLAKYSAADELDQDRTSKRSSRQGDQDLDEESTTSRRSRDEETKSRTRRSRESDGYRDDDSRSVASSGADSKGKKKDSSGFFGGIFSSNKSDVSTSSRKSSKSSKSESRADRDRDDRSESRKKRKSRDKSDFDDVASVASKPTRRSRRSPDAQDAASDHQNIPRDQSIDNGFVSAEEIAESPVKDVKDGESFLANRPEIPEPTVMDMPMGTDGVSGPTSERKPSAQPDNVVSTPLKARFAMEDDLSATDPASLENIRSVGRAASPNLGSSPALPQFAESRRLSAIRTTDVPSSPITTSSPTAVPLSFRRLPLSPTNPRFSMSSPGPAPTSPLTTPRTRQGRPKSTEFRNSKEFRPLYLVERSNFAKRPAPELDQDLPSLPSSRTSSAHSSMENLRAESQAQEHPDYITPSRMSAEMFRQRGRRHSHSYWHDNEKRRESPDYLDSRSATPVPGEVQRARDQEMKPRPKYEFHSPSELLQDPSLLQDVPDVDDADTPQSPLPSVASTDLDYMSARSRSSSPMRARSLSRGRRSASTTRSTSASWHDALTTTAAGVVAGSVLGIAAHEVLQGSTDDVQPEEVATPTKSDFSFKEIALPARENQVIEPNKDRGVSVPMSMAQPRANQPTNEAAEVESTSESPQETTAWKNVFAEINNRKGILTNVAKRSPIVVAKQPEPESLTKDAAWKTIFANINSRKRAQDIAAKESPEQPEPEGSTKDVAFDADPTMSADVASFPEIFEDHPVVPKELAQPQQEDVIDGQLTAGVQQPGEDVAVSVPEPSAGSKKSKKDKKGKKKRTSLTFENDSSPPTGKTALPEENEAEKTDLTPEIPMNVEAEPLNGRKNVEIDIAGPATQAARSEAPPGLPKDCSATTDLLEEVSGDVETVSSPLEEAFEAAFHARGLAEGASVQAAYQSFQPEIPDVGGTQLTTIQEESELSTPAAERELDPTEVEASLSRKPSKKDKRKQKKGNQAFFDDWTEPDATSVARGVEPQPQVDQTEAVTTDRAFLPEELLLAEPTPAEERPNPFGDDFELKPAEVDVTPVAIGSDELLEAPAEVEGSLQPPLKKGKKDKKKKRQSDKLDEAAQPFRPQDLVRAAEPNTFGDDFELKPTDTDEPSIALGGDEPPEAPAEAEDSWQPTLKKGKKDKRKKRQSENWDEPTTNQNELEEQVRAAEPSNKDASASATVAQETIAPQSASADEEDVFATPVGTPQQESEDPWEADSKSGKNKRSKSKKKSWPVSLDELPTSAPEESLAVSTPVAESGPSASELCDDLGQNKDAAFHEELAEDPDKHDLRAVSPVQQAEELSGDSNAQAGAETADHALPEGLEENHASYASSKPQEMSPLESNHQAAEDLLIGVGIVARATIPGALLAMNHHDEGFQSGREKAASEKDVDALTDRMSVENAPCLAEVVKDVNIEENTASAGSRAPNGQESLVTEDPTANAADVPFFFQDVVAETPAQDEESHAGEFAADSAPDIMEIPDDTLEQTSQQDKEIFPNSKKSKKDKKKKRMTTFNDAEPEAAVQEPSQDDDNVTSLDFAPAAERQKDIEAAAVPESLSVQAALPSTPTEDISIPPTPSEDAPQQKDDFFSVPNKKSKKDKKKKRQSALADTELETPVPNLPQDDDEMMMPDVGPVVESQRDIEAPVGGPQTMLPSTPAEDVSVPPTPSEDVLQTHDSYFSVPAKKSKKDKKMKRQSTLAETEITPAVEDADIEKIEKEEPTVTQQAEVPEVLETPAAEPEALGPASGVPPQDGDISPVSVKKSKKDKKKNRQSTFADIETPPSVDDAENGIDRTIEPTVTHGAEPPEVSHSFLAKPEAVGLADDTPQQDEELFPAPVKRAKKDKKKKRGSTFITDEPDVPSPAEEAPAADLNDDETVTPEKFSAADVPTAIEPLEPQAEVVPPPAEEVPLENDDEFAFTKTSKKSKKGKKQRGSTFVLDETDIPSPAEETPAPEQKTEKTVVPEEHSATDVPTKIGIDEPQTESSSAPAEDVPAGDNDDSTFTKPLKTSKKSKKEKRKQQTWNVDFDETPRNFIDNQSEDVLSSAPTTAAEQNREGDAHAKFSGYPPDIVQMSEPINVQDAQGDGTVADASNELYHDVAIAHDPASFLQKAPLTEEHATNAPLKDAASLKSSVDEFLEVDAPTDELSAVEPTIYQAPVSEVPVDGPVAVDTAAVEPPAVEAPTVQYPVNRDIPTLDLPPVDAHAIETSAVPSVADEAHTDSPIAVETPAVEPAIAQTPAVETPGDKILALEPDAPHSPIIETPATENSATEANLEVPSTSGPLEEEEWGIPVKKSKKDKKKKRQSTLATEVEELEPSTSVVPKDLESTKSDFETTIEDASVELAVPEIEASVAGIATQDAPGDDWAPTSKSKKDKKKKRQSNLATEVHEPEPSISVPENLESAKADYEPAIEDASRELAVSDNMAPTADMPTQDPAQDDWAPKTKSKKDQKKKKRQSTLPFNLDENDSGNRNAEDDAQPSRLVEAEPPTTDPETTTGEPKGILEDAAEEQDAGASGLDEPESKEAAVPTVEDDWASAMPTSKKDKKKKRRQYAFADDAIEAEGSANNARATTTGDTRIIESETLSSIETVKDEPLTAEPATNNENTALPADIARIDDPSSQDIPEEWASTSAKSKKDKKKKKGQSTMEVLTDAPAVDDISEAQPLTEADVELPLVNELEQPVEEFSRETEPTIPEKQADDSWAPAVKKKKDKKGSRKSKLDEVNTPADETEGESKDSGLAGTQDIGTNVENDVVFAGHVESDKAATLADQHLGPATASKEIALEAEVLNAVPISGTAGAAADDQTSDYFSFSKKKSKKDRKKKLQAVFDEPETTDAFETPMEEVVPVEAMETPFETPDAMEADDKPLETIDSFTAVTEGTGLVHDDDWTSTATSKSKKSKKKQRQSAIEEPEPIAALETPIDPDDLFQPLNEGAAPVAEEISTESSKSKSKKGKKKRQSTFDDTFAEPAPVVSEVEPVQDQDIGEAAPRDISAAPEAPEPTVEADEYVWNVPKKAKKGKKNRQSVFDDTLAEPAPVMPEVEPTRNQDVADAAPGDIPDETNALETTPAAEDDDWNMPKKVKKGKKNRQSTFDDASIDPLPTTQQSGLIATHPETEPVLQQDPTEAQQEPLVDQAATLDTIPSQDPPEEDEWSSSKKSKKDKKKKRQSTFAEMVDEPMSVEDTAAVAESEKTPDSSQSANMAEDVASSRQVEAIGAEPFSNIAVVPEDVPPTTEVARSVKTLSEPVSLEAPLSAEVLRHEEMASHDDQPTLYAEPREGNLGQLDFSDEPAAKLQETTILRESQPDHVSAQDFPATAEYQEVSSALVDPVDTAPTTVQVGDAQRGLLDEKPEVPAEEDLELPKSKKSKKKKRQSTFDEIELESPQLERAEPDGSQQAVMPEATTEPLVSEPLDQFSVEPLAIDNTLENEWAVPSKKSKKGKKQRLSLLDETPFDSERTGPMEAAVDVHAAGSETVAELTKRDLEDESTIDVPTLEPMVDEEWTASSKKPKKDKKKKGRTLLAEDESLPSAPAEEKTPAQVLVGEQSEADVTTKSVEPLEANTAAEAYAMTESPAGTAMPIPDEQNPEPDLAAVQREIAPMTTDSAAAEEQWAIPSKKSKKDKKKRKQMVALGDFDVDDSLPATSAEPEMFGDAIGPYQTETTGRTFEQSTLDHDSKELTPETVTEGQLETAPELTDNLKDPNEPTKQAEEQATSLPSFEPMAVDQEQSTSGPNQHGQDPKLEPGPLEARAEGERVLASAVDEPATIEADWPLVKKSKKDQRKSKRQSTFDDDAFKPQDTVTSAIEVPPVEAVTAAPNANDIAYVPQTAAPEAPQPEDEWGFSTKKSKKSKKSKTLVMNEDVATPGTATPISTDQFESAAQTPMERAASPEPMEEIQTAETPAVQPDMAGDDYFTPTSGKKKSKKDKKRKSSLAWGNDQPTEDTSEPVMPAPVLEPEEALAPKDDLEMGVASAHPAHNPNQYISDEQHDPSFRADQHTPDRFEPPVDKLPRNMNIDTTPAGTHFRDISRDMDEPISEPGKLVEHYVPQEAIYSTTSRADFVSTEPQAAITKNDLETTRELAVGSAVLNNAVLDESEPAKRKNTKKDKKAKKERRVFEFDGTESVEPRTVEPQQEETRELDVMETIPEESMHPSLAHAPTAEHHLPADVENLSDVSESTRERRRRRRSPPAWSGEEPEDLPKDRALTPPPEHDDFMETALGVAAGLGFGGGEPESTRELPPKPPSPIRQPSAGWSFAKLRPAVNAAAESNRDSGVQFESPLLATDHFSSTRDSGFIPSPATADGEFGSRRDDSLEMKLRPPRPQSPTSSTEDVSKPRASRANHYDTSVLETPRRKPSPVESTTKDRSSVLFNSSPAVLSPLVTTGAISRSPEPQSPLHRSPSIHGHHRSREELRRQKTESAPHHEESERLASNLIDRSVAAPINRSAFESEARPFTPGKPSLSAIREDSTEASSKADLFSEPSISPTPQQHPGRDNYAAASLVAAAGIAAAVSSRDPGAKSLGRSKSRTSSLRNLRGSSISPFDPANFASGSSQDPVNARDTGKSAVRDRDMTDIYDGFGSYPGSPKSPTRPPSVRRRQSMQQIKDLETRLDQLAGENRALVEAKIVAEQHLEHAYFEQNRAENVTNSFNAQLQERDAEIARLKEEVASLAATHHSLRQEHEESLFNIQREHDQAQSEWQGSSKELETLRSRHDELSTGMESIVRHEIDTALAEKNAEILRLRGDLDMARQQIRDLQSQILAQPADTVVVSHDEDYFDQACQKLCQQVQGWVLRFSKFSDLKLCRTTNEVRDEKIVDRFDNAILDGSDVDNYLTDRVKRRDVFMSVVMTMIWEYVFTRYLFGMDREQRQKLKLLEKNLGEVGPTSAVHQWRALTLTLLSKRESFKAQRESDTEAVAIEIFSTLSRFLPPPQNLEEQIVGSLRNVMRTAVDLSIEMRTQRAEYMMLPPLSPEYDTNGDLARKVYFNAQLMNERSGETTSNEDLQSVQAVVRMVLFPLVVKKGDDEGVGDDEIVVCPAQVLVARPDKAKKPRSSTRHASGGSDAKSLRAISTHSLAMSGIEGNENMF